MSDTEKDTTQIWNQIHEIDRKITECNNARSEIVTVMNTCTTQKQSWETSYHVLKNDSELSKVKRKDVFEGKMADSLSGKVSDVMSDISRAITKAGELVFALNTQKTRIDSRIQQLQAQRSNLVNQL